MYYEPIANPFSIALHTFFAKIHTEYALQMGKKHVLYCISGVWCLFGFHKFLAIYSAISTHRFIAFFALHFGKHFSFPVGGHCDFLG